MRWQPNSRPPSTSSSRATAKQQPDGDPLTAALSSAANASLMAFSVRIFSSKAGFRVLRKSVILLWKSLTLSTAMSSRRPFCMVHKMETWISTGIGLYWLCLKSSTMRLPRSRVAWVLASRSEPNWAKAASSRYCAKSSLILPATCFIALICAADPTRLTDKPTEMAGRTPW